MSDPLARPEQDQQVADRHPAIPQDALIPIPPPTCPTCEGHGWIVILAGPEGVLCSTCWGEGTL